MTSDAPPNTTMRPLAPLPVLLLALGTFPASVGAGAANWSQFRGPNGSGVAAAAKPPVKIVAEQAAWRTPLPPGKSSPVLWEAKLFLTGREGGRLATLALDATSGRVLWKTPAPQVRLERVHRANSVAASTPCVDENRLYVYFGSYGLLCYDHEGRELWRKAIPSFSASGPVPGNWDATPWMNRR